MSLDKIISGNIINGTVFFVVGLLPPYPQEEKYSLLNYSLAFGGIAGTVNWKIVDYIRKVTAGVDKETYTWEDAAATSPGAIIGFYLGATVGQSLFR